MSEEKLREIVLDLAKTHSPSHIGHILRDKYHVKIRKLTRYFEELDENKSYLQKLNLKIRFMKFHLMENKKDYVTKRSLDRLLVIQKKLKIKIENNNEQ